MKTKRFLAVFGGVICLVLVCSNSYPGRAAQKQQDKNQSGYGGSTGTTREAEKATKSVAVIIENKSGTPVQFVSWRYWGPEYHYFAHLQDGQSVTVPSFAAEWRMNGVWEDNPPHASRTDWSKAYKFEKNTTITIEKNTLKFIDTP